MLELARDHRVAGRQVRASPRLRDEVDRRGRAAREDHLVGESAEKCRDVAARVLDRRGRLLGERVDAAARRTELRGANHRVDHRLRAQRGRGAVEIREPLAMHARRERGEVSAACGEVCHGHRAIR